MDTIGSVPVASLGANIPLTANTANPDIIRKTPVNVELPPKTFLIPITINSPIKPTISPITPKTLKGSFLRINTVMIKVTIGATETSTDTSPAEIYSSPNPVTIQRYNGTFFGINAQTILDYAHFGSAGVVSFARGLNDTPKIVALLLVIKAFGIQWGMLCVAIGMAAGGLINAKKVANTISKKITPMNHGQGFTANLVTGFLVIAASRFGVPVSTTHVSVGSIFGIGTVTRQANTKVVSEIVLSWVLTLPIAAALSAGVYYLLLNINK